MSDADTALIYSSSNLSRGKNESIASKLLIGGSSGFNVLFSGAHSIAPGTQTGFWTSSGFTRKLYKGDNSVHRINDSYWQEGYCVRCIIN